MIHCSINTSTKTVLFSRPFISLFVDFYVCQFVNRITQIMLVGSSLKTSKRGCWSNLDPFKFCNCHCVDLKKE